MIHLIRSRATKQQVNEMREELLTLIKSAVDVQRSAISRRRVIEYASFKRDQKK
jgi:hypothetical protein